MFTEKEIRRAIREELRTVVLKNKLKKLHEQKEEDVDFNPSNSGSKIPKNLQRLLNPDLSPQKFAVLDGELDDSGSPAHQAIAVAVYALNYADNDQAGAEKILTLAKAAVANLLKQKEESAKE